jgi:hypothetical protein
MSFSKDAGANVAAHKFRFLARNEIQGTVKWPLPYRIRQAQNLISRWWRSAMAEWNGGRDPIATPDTRANQRIEWWLSAVVILGAVLIAAGAIIALVHPAMLVSRYDEINGAVHIYAGYLAARNLALAFMLVALLLIGARRALGNLMVLVALIQILDACMDVAEGRWAIVPGILIFGLVFLIGAARLSGFPFWRLAAWKQ